MALGLLMNSVTVCNVCRISFNLDQNTLVLKVVVQAITNSLATNAGLLVTAEGNVGCECWTGAVDAHWDEG